MDVSSNVTEDRIKYIADQLISTGLAKLGLLSFCLYLYLIYPVYLAYLLFISLFSSFSFTVIFLNCFPSFVYVNVDEGWLKGRYPNGNILGDVSAVF